MGYHPPHLVWRLAGHWATEHFEMQKTELYAARTGMSKLTDARLTLGGIPKEVILVVEAFQAGGLNRSSQATWQRRYSGRSAENYLADRIRDLSGSM